MNKTYFMLSMMAMVMGGCPELRAREVETDGDVDIDIVNGPPCVVTLGVDGHRVQKVTGHGGACNVVVDTPNKKTPDQE